MPVAADACVRSACVFRIVKKVGSDPFGRRLAIERVGRPRSNIYTSGSYYTRRLPAGYNNSYYRVDLLAAAPVMRELT